LGRVRRQQRRRADSCFVGSRYDGGDGDGRPGNRLWPSPEHDDDTGKNRPDYGCLKNDDGDNSDNGDKDETGVCPTGGRRLVYRDHCNTIILYRTTVCQRLTHHRRHTKMRSRASSSLRRDDNNNNNNDYMSQAKFRFSRVITVVAAVVEIAGTPPTTGHWHILRQYHNDNIITLTLHSILRTRIYYYYYYYY